MLTDFSFSLSYTEIKRSVTVCRVSKPKNLRFTRLGENFKTEEMPYYNVLEYAKMQAVIKEAQDETIRAKYGLAGPDTVLGEDGLPVSDYSGYREFKSTGNEEWDRNIRIASEYYDSCFDFTNQADFEKMSAEEDFTGMSASEKYKAIYEKYQHCFGENFLDAEAEDFSLIPSDYEKWNSVLKSFHEEVNSACGGEEKAKKARAEALYGENGSAHEVRQAIIEKYVTDGNLTVRDFRRMINEMDLCGVGGGIKNSDNKCSSVPTSIDEYVRGSEKAESAAGCLLTKSDISELISAYESKTKNGVKADYGAALEQIIGSLGDLPDGESNIMSGITYFAPERYVNRLDADGNTVGKVRAYRGLQSSVCRPEKRSAKEIYEKFVKDTEKLNAMNDPRISAARFDGVDMDMLDKGGSKGTELQVFFGNEEMRDFFWQAVKRGIISSEDADYASGKRVFTRSIVIRGNMSLPEYLKKHGGRLMGENESFSEVFSYEKSTDVLEYLDRQTEIMRQFRHKAGKNGGASADGREISLFMTRDEIDRCIESLERVRKILSDTDKAQ